MKIVVTGGAGFIGANLCRHLLTGPADDVVAVDNLSTGFADNLDGVGATLIEGSILDADVLDEAMAGADGVVHLAALGSVPRSVKDPETSHENNATGTLRVLEAARRAGNPHVVLASSSSVYGANPTLPKHEGLATMPLSPYAVSKLATETYALAYQACYGLPVLAFRFFNVFGPLQAAGHAYAAVVPAFVDAAMRGVPLTVHGDGHQSRDFTYVDTVCRVITDALVRKVTHEGPVNLAFGSRTDLIEVIGILEGLLGHPVERDHTDPRAGDVRHSQADSSRLHELFPDIEPVSLEEGLAATVEWFRSQAEGS